jgi:cytidylate kinase
MNADLLSYLFFPDDIIELRFLPERGAAARPLKKLCSGIDAARDTLAQMRDIVLDAQLYPCAGVNPRDKKGNVARQQTVFVDIDNAALPVWAHEHADIICSRDSTHHHLYFVFEPRDENETNKASYSAVVKQLLTLTQSKERAAHDSARVARLPDFSHRKNGVRSPGYEIVYVREQTERVSFEQRFAFLSALISQPPAQAPQRVNSIVDYLFALYSKKPVRVASDGRSQELFFIGLDCHAWGVPESDAVALAQRISDLRHEPPESEKVIKHQIASAFKYRRGDFGDLLRKSESLTDKQRQKELRKFELINRARELLSAWVYCHSAVRLLDTTTTRVLTSIEQINLYLISQLGERIDFADLIAAGAVNTVDELDYAPDMTEKIFVRGGVTYYNAYRAPELAPVDPESERAKEAVKIFREHIAYITTSEQEEQTLLQFFAYALQNPGKKIMWSPLIITPKTGVGKSFFAEFLARICGEQNVSHVMSHDLLSKYNDYLAEKLWVVAHEVETGEKEAMARLKSLISEKRLRVETKYARTYTTTNAANFIFLSNKIDAIKSDREDRRLFVIYNNTDPREQEYYTRLFRMIENDAEAVREYLLTVDVSSFNPHRRPPKTAGWEMLARASESDLSAFLSECEAAKQGPFASEYFTLHDLHVHIELNAQSCARYATNRALAVWLYGRGYQNREAHVHGRHVRAWTKLPHTQFLDALKNEVKKEIDDIPY